MPGKIFLYAPTPVTSASIISALGYTPADVAGSTGNFVVTGTTQTGSSANSFVSITGIWNTTGTPTADLLNVTDTASNAASLLMDRQVGGVSKFKVGKDGTATLASAAALNWNSDTYLYRDGSDILAIRRGVNAQAVRIYNTYTDPSNFERSVIGYYLNVFYIGAESLGTGSARPVIVGSNPTGTPTAVCSIQGTQTRLFSSASSSAYWQMNSSGAWVTSNDNTWDLGASGNQVRSLYIGTDIKISKTVTAGGTTGAQTINKTAGSVNFAAAATSLVVTDSLVTTSSIIVATVATNDTTLKSVQAVAGSGSFTLYANAAATAETRVNFLITN